MSIPTVLEHAVFEVPDFVTPAFCSEIIQKAAEIGYHTATINSEKSLHPDIRNNDRVIFDDPAMAQHLWHRVRPYFSAPIKGERAVCLNERFRFYRYTPGQFFDWHQDGTYHATETRVSRFTMMIYLNDACEGGGTSFADVFSPHVFKDFTIQPATGKALLFHHPLSHRGDPVVNGVKYVLRTDVMFEKGTV